MISWSCIVEVEGIEYVSTLIYATVLCFERRLEYQGFQSLPRPLSHMVTGPIPRWSIMGDSSLQPLHSNSITPRLPYKKQPRSRLFTFPLLRGRIQPRDIARSRHLPVESGSLILLAPCHHALEVPASVPHVEVWPWRYPPGNPGVGDDADVRVAGELLPEHFDAVV